MQTLNGVPTLHDELTLRWHTEALETWRAPADPWLSLVAQQHLANYELWHTEDLARTPNASDSELARVKRRIDSTNQNRNDLAEQIDAHLLSLLSQRDLPNPHAPLHSESPGLIIDRLSILALKLFHTAEELDRPGAPVGHAERNRDRLAILIEQRSDLAACLNQLWADALIGQRRFKHYRQLKMYNDPTLNPSVYLSSRHF